jgi:two-component system chemotaxis response regulator CheB
MSAPVRVLVVDDSAFARKVFRMALSRDPQITVVGTAADGLEGLEKIAELQPDVVTLDLMMPELDGVGVLRELASLGSPARVLIVSISDETSELAAEALQLGAVDWVKKPTALATERLNEISSELVRKVLDAARARSQLVAPLPPPERVRLPTGSRISEVVVVGTSTGGPQALTRLLSALPAGFPVPVAIGLHIPADYTEAVAHRLDMVCALEVVEARDGLPMEAGRVVLARGGSHLRLERAGGQVLARVQDHPTHTAFRPSIDLLFESAASVYGAGTLGVVLTGMGDDGLLGSRSIVGRGGRVLTEAEASCVVYGMPRVVAEAGLSSGEARIEEMASKLVRSI